jgi:hypothetical protein
VNAKWSEQFGSQPKPTGFKPQHVRQIYAFLDQLAESTRLERVPLDGRRLLADSDIRIIGWQHLAFVISDAIAIVRAPGVRS